MKILSTTITSTVTETTEVEYQGKKYVLIDTTESSGKIVDTILRDEEGNDINDPEILDAIECFLSTEIAKIFLP